MKLLYRLIDLRDPKDGSAVVCRQGEDGIVVPRRHRVGYGRLAEAARLTRLAERRAARLYNFKTNHILWPPYLDGEVRDLPRPVKRSPAPKKAPPHPRHNQWPGNRGRR